MVHADIYDLPRRETARPALRAKYLGAGGGFHSWLVFADDADSCGSILLPENGTAHSRFAAYAHGRLLGLRHSIAEAIGLTLSPPDRRTFHGM